MFVHLSIHRVRPEAAEALAESMHRFGAAGATQPGFLGGHVLKDRRTGRLVGMTLWQSEDEWRSALPLQGAAVEGDPFDKWEIEQPEIFHLDEV